jgi:hypothetical protein
MVHAIDHDDYPKDYIDFYQVDAIDHGGDLESTGRWIN